MKYGFENGFRELYSMQIKSFDQMNGSLVKK